MTKKQALTRPSSILDHAQAAADAVSASLRAPLRRDDELGLLALQMIERQPEPPIYDGQDRAGTVIRQDGEFFAFDAEGKCLGTFDTMLEATRKIPPVRAQETAP